MTSPALGSMLLSSTDPQRLRDWYVAAFEPQEINEGNGYRILRFGEFRVLIDSRPDIGDKNLEPGRVIFNFHVDDARAVAARVDKLGTIWLAELEDRDGGVFATAIDPDGNYVQIIQLTE